MAAPDVQPPPPQGNDCHYVIALSLDWQFVIVNIYEVPSPSTEMIIIKKKGKLFPDGHSSSQSKGPEEEDGPKAEHVG